MKKALLLAAGILASSHAVASNRQQALEMKHFSQSVVAEINSILASGDFDDSFTDSNMYDAKVRSKLSSARDDIYNAGDAFDDSAIAFDNGNFVRGDDYYETGCTDLSFANLSIGEGALAAVRGDTFRPSSSRIRRLNDRVDRSYNDKCR